MADPPPYRDSDGDTGTPRWVKVFGIIAIGVVVLFVVVMLIGGGEHGPGRHPLSGGVGGHIPPASIMEHGEQQP